MVERSEPAIARHVARAMSDPNLDSIFQTLAQNNPDLVAAMLVDPSGRVSASQSIAPEVTRAAVALARDENEEG